MFSFLDYEKKWYDAVTRHTRASKRLKLLEGLSQDIHEFGDAVQQFVFSLYEMYFIHGLEENGSFRLREKHDAVFMSVEYDAQVKGYRLYFVIRDRNIENDIEECENG